MIRLICLDMDGVLSSEKNFWLEAHKAYGTLEEGKALTKRYLHTDYDRLVEEVIGRLWKGKDEETFRRLVREIPLMDGIGAFFLELDRFRMPDGKPVPRAIMTSGPYELADRIKALHGADFIFANQMVFEHGKVTGEFRQPVGAGTHAKVTLLEGLCQDLGILPTEVLYVGDSSADIDLFKVVGAGIAFNDPPQELKALASYVVESQDLADVVPALEKIRATQW